MQTCSPTVVKGSVVVGCDCQNDLKDDVRRVDQRGYNNDRDEVITIATCKRRFFNIDANRGGMTNRSTRCEHLVFEGPVQQREESSTETRTDFAAK